MKNVVILAPISNNYFNYFDAISGGTSNNYLIFIMKKHRNSYPEKLPYNIKLISLNIWNESYIDFKIDKFFHGKVDYIYAYEEEQILFSAELREKYKVTNGQNIKSAQEFRNKLKMVELAHQSGLATPEYYPVNNIYDLIEAKRKIGYPLIVKPLDGMGSVATFLIRNDEQLKNIAKNKILTNYLAEEYIPWPLYHVDGFVNNRKLVYLITSEYFDNTLEVINGKSVGSVQILEESPTHQLIKEYTEKLLKVFDTPDNYLFHLEVFSNGKGVKLCEIGSRLGGGRILQEIEHQFNFNPIQELLKIDLGLPSVLDKNKQYHINQVCGFVLVSPRHGRLVKFPSEEDVKKYNKAVYDYYPYAQIGRQYDGAHSSIESIMAVSISDRTSEQVRHELLQIDSWVKQNTVYE